MKGLQFTVEEKQLLVEALLFTSCTDVCSEHTQAHRVKMLELAERLNKDNGKLFNVYLFKEDTKEKETEIVLSKFPNVPIEEI